MWQKATDEIYCSGGRGRSEKQQGKSALCFIAGAPSGPNQRLRGLGLLSMSGQWMSPDEFRVHSTDFMTNNNKQLMGGLVD